MIHPLDSMHLHRIRLEARERLGDRIGEVSIRTRATLAADDAIIERTTFEVEVAFYCGCMAGELLELDAHYASGARRSLWDVLADLDVQLAGVRARDELAEQPADDRFDRSDTT